MSESKRFHDSDYLHEQHHVRRKSVRRIAKENDVNYTTIQYWMRKHGVDRRDRKESSATETRRQPVYHGWKRGWEVVSADGDYAAVHQLVAIANGVAPEKVFSNKDWVCHHKNGVKWDNRPENIDVLTNSDHAKLHAERREEQDA